jgi:hypothetical protein
MKAASFIRAFYMAAGAIARKVAFGHVHVAVAVHDHVDVNATSTSTFL